MTNRPIVLGWLALHLLGGAVAGLLEAEFQFLGTLVLAGLPIAVVQWLYLRHRRGRAIPWALAFALGWPVAHLCYTLLPAWYTPLIRMASTYTALWEVFWINLFRLATVLLIISLVQWLVALRRQRNGWYWIPAGTLGGALLGAVGATVCRYGCDVINVAAGPSVVGVVLGALGWGAYATVTGPILAQLLTSSTPNPPSSL
ncbi:MAG: hypothetical protein R2932_50460 [Caldilineaceae bacterium]